MTFDKDKVYTALNADELEPGDRVIVADELANLKGEVENFCCSDELIKILPENNKDRFVIEGYESSFALAYLIEKNPYAHWIKNDNNTYSCSKCYSWIPEKQHHYAKYCLHCGARMEDVK